MRRLALAIFLISCGDTGQEHVELALSATGTAARPITLGDAQLTLTRADVSFGPMYLCASESGRAELCEVAVAEFLGTVAVRALDPAVQPLGQLEATTGSVRSGLYDYGVSWLLTANMPRANAGSVEQHSALIEGTLTRGAQSVRFSATLDIQPRQAGDLAVNGQVTRFSITSANNTLTMAADPNAWVSQLDPDALFALDTDGDGAVIIPADSVLHESLLQGLTSRAPLRFVWQ